MRLDFPIGEFVERMNSEESPAAFNACSHLLSGVTQQFVGFDRLEMEDRLLRCATCMRENGYELPDPEFSSGSPFDLDANEEPGPFGGLDSDDPAFQAANEACEGELAGVLDPVPYAAPYAIIGTADRDTTESLSIAADPG